jgi:serine/threonine protein kinase
MPTAPEERVESLLIDWDLARQRGHLLTPAELAPDEPELHADLQAAIDQQLRVLGHLEAPRLSHADAPQIPGYQLDELLGEGGMGRVYAAIDLVMQRSVALKTLRADLLDVPLARTRFLREAQALAQLKHDHVVPIYSVNDEPLPYLVMPLLQGETLEKRLRRERLVPVELACEIGRQTAVGLAAVHAVGLIHRDLKPANLWLEARATGVHVRLLDFGLARLDGSELTNTGERMGTPSYMAPEQVDGLDVDARTDLYSLGVILYELLSGQLPFPQASLPARYEAIRQQPPPTLPLHLAPELTDLVLRLLAKAPANRPTSAATVAATLQVLATAPSVPPLPSVADLPGDYQPTLDQQPVPTDDGPLPMTVALRVIDGPHTGQSFTFAQRDSFLVGRGSSAHFRFNYDDPYFSRNHFIDLRSRNGTFVNAVRVEVAELTDGALVRAGHTTFRVVLQHGSTVIPPTHAWLPVADFELPGYRLAGEVGRGALGVVYRAERLADGATVAIKVLLPNAAANEQDAARFVREVDLLARLQHQYIVRWYETGLAESGVYLVMEYLTGPTVAQWLEQHGPLPLRSAVRLMGQVLTALAYAHGEGVVHRDVKPANILLHGQGAERGAKLTDFGLARLFDETRLHGPTLSGEHPGTLDYMAPEQVTHYRDVGPAADQFAAAATLYRLLSGRSCRQLSRGPAASLDVTENQIIPLHSVCPTVPIALAEIIERALRTVPTARFPDVRAFNQALKPWR